MERGFLEGPCQHPAHSIEGDNVKAQASVTGVLQLLRVEALWFDVVLPDVLGEFLD